MALKDIWEDRIDGVDEMTAEDINLVARSVIENEEDIKSLKDKKNEITIDAEMSNESENPVQNKVVKNYVDGLVGDIDSALDELHNYAQGLIGGA